MRVVFPSDPRDITVRQFVDFKNAVDDVERMIVDLEGEQMGVV
jgi:hypothetical protein